MPDIQIQVVPVTPFQQNCSLIWSQATKHGVVVDPGGDVATIREAIRRAGITVDYILLTHGHIDHAGGAAELAEALGVEVVGPHEADKPLLDRLEIQAAQWGLDGTRNVTPSRYLKEGDTIEIAGVPFEVLHCPGHSAGSVVLFAPSLRFAFMGDVLFQGSVGRTDFPRGDHETLLRSIREKLFPLGDDVVFLPGHGSPGQIGEERLNNPFLNE